MSDRNPSPTSCFAEVVDLDEVLAEVNQAGWRRYCDGEADRAVAEDYYSGVWLGARAGAGAELAPARAAL